MKIMTSIDRPLGLFLPFHLMARLFLRCAEPVQTLIGPSAGRRAERRSRVASSHSAGGRDEAIGSLPSVACPSSPPARRSQLGRRWAYRVAFGRAAGGHVEGPGRYL